MIEVRKLAIRVCFKHSNGVLPATNPTHLVKNNRLASKNESQETSVAYITAKNPSTKKQDEACHAGIMDTPYEQIDSYVPLTNWS